MVFLHDDENNSIEENDAAAHAHATKALSAYWQALQGTLPAKVEKAANNALVGSPETIAKQIVDRYHPEDRLMLWFDFFNHDNAHVSMMMEQFQAKVAPLVQQSLKKQESECMTINKLVSIVSTWRC